MITILGAGGAIGNELVKLLVAKNQPFRLVGRSPKATPGATETLAADLMDKDQTIRAAAGSSVVHLLVGLKYDHTLKFRGLGVDTRRSSRYCPTSSCKEVG
jgi:uncharacterized protein YbjT (DUF2867 family)